MEDFFIKTLIGKVDRNVLYHSTFLKETIELESIYSLVLAKDRVEEQDVFDAELKKKIKRGLNEWLRVSLNEWKLDTTKSPYTPTVEEKTEHKFKCDFCNKTLTAEVNFFQNRLNGEVITVGESCAKKVGSPEFLINSRIATNTVEQKRYESLLRNFPALDFLSTKNITEVDFYEFILPADLANDHKATYRKIKGNVKRYLRTGKHDRKVRHISSELDEYTKIQQKIRKFEDKAAKNPNNYCKLDDLRNEARIEGKGKKERLFNLVRRNGGLMNANLASEIINFKFLEDVILYYKDTEMQDLYEFEAIGDNLIRFRVSLNNRNMVFFSPSAPIIKMYEYPLKKLRFITPSELLEVLRSNLTPDHETEEMFLRMYVQMMVNELGFEEYYLTPSRIWSDYYEEKQEDWLIAKYSSNIFLRKANNIYLVNKKEATSFVLNNRLGESKSPENEVQAIQVKGSETQFIQQIKMAYELER